MRPTEYSDTTKLAIALAQLKVLREMVLSTGVSESLLRALLADAAKEVLVEKGLR